MEDWVEVCSVEDCSLEDWPCSPDVLLLPASDELLVPKVALNFDPVVFVEFTVVLLMKPTVAFASPVEFVELVEFVV